LLNYRFGSSKGQFRRPYLLIGPFLVVKLWVWELQGPISKTKFAQRALPCCYITDLGAPRADFEDHICSEGPSLLLYYGFGSSKGQFRRPYLLIGPFPVVKLQIENSKGRFRRPYLLTGPFLVVKLWVWELQGPISKTIFAQRALPCC